MHRLMALVTVIVALSFNAWGQELRITSATVVRFASLEEGRRVLGARDEFIMAMSAYDRAARMGIARDNVSEEEFLKFSASCTLPWTAAEISSVSLALEALKPAARELKLDLPERILLVKSSGADAIESHPSHTRGEAIVIAARELAQPMDRLRSVVAHQVFHILTRRDPALRARLYELLGYRICEPIELPEPLNTYRITTPESPLLDHITTVTEQGKPVTVVPARTTFAFKHRDAPASAEETTVTQEGELWSVAPYLGRFPSSSRLRKALERKPFNYAHLNWRAFLALEQAGGGWRVRMERGGPVLVSPDWAPGQRVSEPTRAPEETLAGLFEVATVDPQRYPRSMKMLMREMELIASKAAEKYVSPDAISSATRDFDDDLDAIRRNKERMGLVSSLRVALIEHGKKIEQERASLRINGATEVRFASLDEGRALLATADEFTRQMSPYDRTWRMRTRQDPGEGEFRQFAAGCARAWSADDLKKMTATLGRVKKALGSLKLSLPKRVLLVKSSGAEESGCAYTRLNAIMVPEAWVRDWNEEALCRMLVHECFHVMSRHDPKLRSRLYAVIGFHPCRPVGMPASLASRMVTNPDSPLLDYYIILKSRKDGALIPAIPVLANFGFIEDRFGGGFVLYNGRCTSFIEVESSGERWRARTMFGEPVFVTQRTNFIQQVGRPNHPYLQPEEILAGNFETFVLDPQAIITFREMFASLSQKQIDAMSSATQDHPVQVRILEEMRRVFGRAQAREVASPAKKSASDRSDRSDGSDR